MGYGDKDVPTFWSLLYQLHSICGNLGTSALPHPSRMISARAQDTLLLAVAGGADVEMFPLILTVLNRDYSTPD